MNLQVHHQETPTRKVRFQKTGLDYSVSWSVIGLFAIFALIALHLASFVLIPLTMAIVVGLILGIAADRMGGLGIPPTLTAVILSGLFLIILLFLIGVIWTPVNMLVENGPGMIERAIAYLAEIPWLERPMAALSRGQDNMQAMLENSGTILSTLAAGVTPALVQVFIFISALLLFLSSRLKLRRALIRAFSDREKRLKAIRMLNEVEEALGYYFATAVVVYGLFGVIAALVAWIGGLGSPLLWGVAAFLMSFIPFLGIALVTGAMAIAGLLVHDGILLGLLPAIVFFVFDGVFENLMIPALMGKRLELNSFMLFVAIVFWTWLWGAVGAMLAVPLTLICMTLYAGIIPSSKVTPNLPG
ncbi:AI-2E family transporter [Rhizobium sp. AAP43]|uniref:AI-2E family transporter n=1 Tax=Rhizobium sp. AAP43 TaxID=1523420 RepID=UPI0006B9A2E3|nr:AI-2E family transporter [Rhizobium sp. AAP43]KPF46952.1 permease [Rhizobium sp. AAP43]